MPTTGSVAAASRSSRVSRAFALNANSLGRMVCVGKWEKASCVVVRRGQFMLPESLGTAFCMTHMTKYWAVKHQERTKNLYEVVQEFYVPNLFWA